MSSIMPAAKLTRRELRMLGPNVMYAVAHDGDELAAVNRSIAVHGEAVDELAVPVRVLPRRQSLASSGRNSAA